MEGGIAWLLTQGSREGRGGVPGGPLQLLCYHILSLLSREA